MSYPLPDRLKTWRQFGQCGNLVQENSNLEKVRTLPASAALLGNPSQEMSARALGVRKKSEFISKLHNLPANTESNALLIRSKTPEPLKQHDSGYQQYSYSTPVFQVHAHEGMMGNYCIQKTLTSLLILPWSGPANFTHLLLGKSCCEKQQECYTQLALDTGSLSEM